jgi:hypothetical protein
VIDDETITSLTMKATKAFDMRAIRRRILDNESKINGNSLIALCSTTGRVNTTCSLVKFGLDTDRTGIKGTGFRDGRNAGGEVMCLSKTPRVNVTEVLMPQVT